MGEVDENVFLDVNNTHPTIATVDVEAEDSNITATIGANIGLLTRLFERVWTRNPPQSLCSPHLCFLSDGQP